MMYEMDYEMAKKAFMKKGRINDHNSGSFEVIGRVCLTKCLEGECASCGEKLNCFKFDSNELVKKIMDSKANIEVYSFEGEEPLRAMEFIRNIKSKHLAHKKCEIKTSAPIEYWWKKGKSSIFNEQKEDTWKDFQNIIIKRYAVDDADNNELIGERALTEKMYLSMDEELKKRISFLVDCEKAQIFEVRAAWQFIDFAKRVGINEIVFDFGKESDKRKIQEECDKEILRMKACIEKVRKGEKLHRSMIDPVRGKVSMPLFTKVRNFLIESGWHFDITKAISEKDAFFTKVILRKGKMKVVLKQKILKEDDKQQMWRFSRSHKYIVEL